MFLRRAHACICLWYDPLTSTTRGDRILSAIMLRIQDWQHVVYGMRAMERDRPKYRANGLDMLYISDSLSANKFF
jgi:hypothetical protein